MSEAPPIRIAIVDDHKMLLGALADEPGAARDIVLLNAGATLYAANVAPSIAEGIELARHAIRSGAARARLDQFVEVSRHV